MGDKNKFIPPSDAEVEHSFTPPSDAIVEEPVQKKNPSSADSSQPVEPQSQPSSQDGESQIFDIASRIGKDLHIQGKSMAFDAIENAKKPVEAPKNNDEPQDKKMETNIARKVEAVDTEHKATQEALNIMNHPEVQKKEQESLKTMATTHGSISEAMKMPEIQELQKLHDQYDQANDEQKGKITEEIKAVKDKPIVAQMIPKGLTNFDPTKPIPTEQNTAEGAVTVGKIWDKYAKERSEFNDAHKVYTEIAGTRDALVKKSQELNGFKVNADGVHEISGVRGIPEAFIKGIGDQMDNMKMGLMRIAPYMSGDVVPLATRKAIWDQKLKEASAEKYIKDAILAPTETKGYIAGASETLGSMAPLAVSSVIAPEIPLAQAVMGGTVMGMSGLGAGFHQAYAEAKNQNMSDDQAVQYANKASNAEGATQAVLGAALPMTHLVLPTAEMGAVEKFLKETPATAALFAGQHAASNLLQGKDAMEGQGEVLKSAVGLSGLQLLIGLGVKLPEHIQSIYDVAMARRYEDIKPTIQAGIENKTISPEDGNAILSNAKHNDEVIKRLPPDWTAEELMKAKPYQEKIDQLHTSLKEANNPAIKAVIERQIEDAGHDMIQAVGTHRAEAENQREVKGRNLVKDDELLSAYVDSNPELSQERMDIANMKDDELRDKRIEAFGEKATQEIPDKFEKEFLDAKKEKEAKLANTDDIEERRNKEVADAKLSVAQDAQEEVIKNINAKHDAEIQSLKDKHAKELEGKITENGNSENSQGVQDGGQKEPKPVEGGSDASGSTAKGSDTDMVKEASGDSSTGYERHTEGVGEVAKEKGIEITDDDKDVIASIVESSQETDRPLTVAEATDFWMANKESAPEGAVIDQEKGQAFEKEHPDKVDADNKAFFDMTEEEQTKILDEYERENPTSEVVSDTVTSQEQDNQTASGEASKDAKAESEAGGQEQAGETDSESGRGLNEEDTKLVSTKNSFNKADREVLKVTPADLGPYKAEEALVKAKTRVDSGEVNPDDVVNKILAKKPIDEIETSVFDEDVLRYHKLQLTERGRALNKEKANLIERVETDPADKTAQMDLATTQQKLFQHYEQDSRVDQAMIVGGNIWHKSGLARQVVINEQNQVQNSIRTIKAAYGDSVPPEVQMKLNDLQMKYDELSEKMERLQDKISKGEAQSAFSKRRSNRVQTKEALDQNKVEIVSRMKEKLAKIAEKAADKSGGKKNAIESSSDETSFELITSLAPDIIDLAKNYAERNILKIEDVVDGISEDLKGLADITKQQIRDAIGGVYNEKTTRSELAKQVADLRSQAKAHKAIEDLENGILQERRKRGESSPALKEMQEKLAELRKNIVNENPQASASKLTQEAESIQRKIDKGEYFKMPFERRKWEKDPDWIKANKEKLRLKDELNKLETEALSSQKNMYMKGLDWTNRWTRRAIFIGSTSVYAKLSSAAIIGSFAHRLPEQAIGVGLSKLFPHLAKSAPIEGSANMAAEIKFYTEFLNPVAFAKNIKDIVKTGETPLSRELGSLHGEHHIPIVDLLAADSHVILKNPVERAAFEASFMNYLKWYSDNGVDYQHPLMVESARQAAYGRALYEKFQNPKDTEQTITSINSYFNELERSGILNGNKDDFMSKAIGNTQYTAAALYHFFVPINQVPKNIVTRVGLGLKVPYMLGKAFAENKAVREGIKELSTTEADAIMRQLKKGSIMSAYWLLGFGVVASAGGLYTGFLTKRDRKLNTPMPDELNLFGLDIPKTVQHTPQFQAMQLGAQFRLVRNHYIKDKGEGVMSAAAYGAGSMAGSMAEGVPTIAVTTSAIEAGKNKEGFDKFAKDQARKVGVYKAEDAYKYLTDKEGYDAEQAGKAAEKQAKADKATRLKTKDEVRAQLHGYLSNDPSANPETLFNENIPQDLKDVAQFTEAEKKELFETASWDDDEMKFAGKNTENQRMMWDKFTNAEKRKYKKALNKRNPDALEIIPDED